MSAQAMELEVVKPGSAPAASNVVTPLAVLDRAVEAGAPIETIERLMAMVERGQQMAARQAFDAAMSEAAGKIPVIFKNRKVDFTTSKGRTHYQYEDLAGISKAVKPILEQFGLSYRFRTTSNPNEPVTVTCIVSHRDGYSEENTLSAGRDDSGNKNSIQAIGSTITYLQRMTLKAALGLAASDDDDGKSAEPSATVTEDQASELRDLIESVDADAAKFCAFFKVQSIASIPAKRFDEAVKALRDFGRKNGARA
jgi:hypothetical protein